jgi:uncharacterized membrane protein
MKNCVSCGASLNDDQAFCTACGAQQPEAAPAPGAAPVYTAPAPAYDPYDHTFEFDAQDISDNKCFAMLVYIMSIVGIIIALLASKDSPYTKFHIRQAIKLEVCTILSAVLCVIPFLGWIAFGVCNAIILVLKIIAFFQVCGGKAKEPAIIRGLKFLK